VRPVPASKTRVEGGNLAEPEDQSNGLIDEVFLAGGSGHGGVEE
jgi:hypothetical protein